MKLPERVVEAIQPPDMGSAQPPSPQPESVGQLLWRMRWWWLSPILLFFGLLLILLVLTDSAAIQPFIYALF